MTRSPWTHEELDAMQARLKASINQTEAERPNIRALPPMTEDEARDLLYGLAETAQSRLLTDDEVFLHGQLIAAYRMAVRASTLGHKGRFFVMSEADVERAAALESKE